SRLGGVHDGVEASLLPERTGLDDRRGLRPRRGVPPFSRSVRRGLSVGCAASHRSAVAVSAKRSIACAARGQPVRRDLQRSRGGEAALACHPAPVWQTAPVPATAPPRYYHTAPRAQINSQLAA